MSMVGPNLFYAPMPDVRTRDSVAILECNSKSSVYSSVLMGFQISLETLRGPLMNFLEQMSALFRTSPISSFVDYRLLCSGG